MVNARAKAAKTPTERLAESLDNALNLGAQEADTEGGDLESELRELAGGKVRVSKVSGVRGEAGGFMFSVDTDEFSLDDLLTRIRDEYGGGTYRIRVFSGGRFVVNRNIDVAAPIKKPETLQPLAPAAQSQDRFAEVLMTMQENTRAMIEGLRDQQIQSAQNMQETLLRIMEVSNRAGPTQSPTDFLGILTLAKELFANKGGGDMKAFLDGVKFARDGGGDGDSNPVTEMVKGLAAPLMALANSAQVGANHQPPMQPQRLPAPVAPIAPAVAPVAPAQPQVISAENLPASEQSQTGAEEAGQQFAKQLADFSPYVNMLLAAAAVDASPDTYADMILDLMPEEQIFALIEDDQKFEQFMQFVPAANSELRPWFDALRATLLRFIAEMNEPEGEETDVPGQLGQGNLPDDTGSEDTD
jgi:hypothetical protein